MEEWRLLLILPYFSYERTRVYTGTMIRIFPQNSSRLTNSWSLKTFLGRLVLTFGAYILVLNKFIWSMKNIALLIHFKCKLQYKKINGEVYKSKIFYTLKNLLLLLVREITAQTSLNRIRSLRIFPAYGHLWLSTQ